MQASGPSQNPLPTTLPIPGTTPTPVPAPTAATPVPLPTTIPIGAHPIPNVVVPMTIDPPTTPVGQNILSSATTLPAASPSLTTGQITQTTLPSTPKIAQVAVPILAPTTSPLDGVDIVVTEVTPSLAPPPPSSSTSPSTPPATSAPAPALSSTAITSPSPVTTTPTPEKMIEAAKAKNNDATKSTQSALHELVSDVRKIANVDEGSIRIQPKLANQDGLLLETFSYPNQSDQIYYKINVTYSIEYSTTGTPAQNHSLEITRTIFTTATKPETAIMIARKLTELTVALAESEIPGRTPRVENADKAKAMDKTSFSFQVEHTTAGKPSSVRSIQISEGQASHSFNLKKKDDEVYYYDSSHELRAVNNRDQDALDDLKKEGRKTYPSQDAASVDATYRFNDEGLYGLNQDQLLKEIEGTFDEIAKKKDKISKLKGKFYQEPVNRFFRLFTRDKSDKMAKDFEEYVSQMDWQKKKESEMTPEMIKYLEAKAKLHKMNQGVDLYSRLTEDLRASNIHTIEDVRNFITLSCPLLGEKDALIQEYESQKNQRPSLTGIQFFKEKQQAEKNQLEISIKQLQKVILKDQGTYNTSLREFQKLNTELGVQIKKLEMLQEKAKNAISQTSEIEKAEAVLKAISGRLEDLNKQYNKNQEIIDKIEEQILSPLGIGLKDASSSVQANQGIDIQKLAKTVPGDGNCLFYAVAVGIKKKLAATGQQNLGWTIDNSALNGKLDETMLRAPAANLRSQASEWLMSELAGQDTNPLVEEQIDAGILDEIDALKSKKRDFEKTKKEDFIPKGLPTTSIDQDIAAIDSQIVKFTNSDKSANHRQYIEYASENVKFVGSAHIQALSDIYQIQIQVHKDGLPYPEKFDPIDASHKAVIHLRLKGNHYDYLDM